MEGGANRNRGQKECSSTPSKAKVRGLPKTTNRNGVCVGGLDTHKRRGQKKMNGGNPKKTGGSRRSGATEMQGEEGNERGQGKGEVACEGGTHRGRCQWNVIKRLGRMRMDERRTRTFFPAKRYLVRSHTHTHAGNAGETAISCGRGPVVRFMQPLPCPRHPRPLCTQRQEGREM